MALAVILALSCICAPTNLTDCVAIGSVSRGGRIPFPTDPVVQRLVNGDFVWPKEGDALGEKKWEKATANADGWFEGRPFSGGYAAFTVNWPKDEIVLLEATGSGAVYVNGQPRGGDVYAFGYGRLPIHLESGENHLLVATGRGRLKMAIESRETDAALNPADLTVPDVVSGSSESLFGAIIVENLSQNRRRNLSLVSSIGSSKTAIRVPSIAPVSFRKCRFDFPDTSALKGETAEMTVALMDGDRTLDKATFTVRLRRPDQSRKETFMSAIDGSVQYYAVQPPPEPRPGLALVLTVHGASVEALGQADAYSPKPWCWIVAATNRRPYGFDWEDWGRMDAMEVLEHVQAKYKTDGSRTFLTGHSMGGHGTWQLGALFPDVFAAIAPSAGWRSFYTYGGKPRITDPTPMEALFERASSPSDTERWAENYATEQVFILHGDADDNVPVSEARAMKAYFEKVGKPIGYFEQPGAGHWWDGDKAAGADCVDWPDIFSMFERSRLARWNGTPLKGTMKFVTPNPSVSSRMDFLQIRQQDKKLDASRVTVNAGKDGMDLVTENVKSFRTVAPLATIDGKPAPAGDPAASFNDYVKANDAWTLARGGAKMQTGPLKEGFQRNMAFIYGTRGTHEENAWAFSKARFDAEQWWYRGNGAVDVIADVDFVDSLPRRNVILYGNRDMNLVWQRLMVTGPIHLGKDFVNVEGKNVRGDLGAIFAYEQDGRMIVGIGGSTVKGMRSTERLPYFSSGVAFPDWTVVNTEYPTLGVGGVVGAGFWGEPGTWKKP